MLEMPFLTQIDPRARIKGSRDPLGLQPIWSQLGRRVVRNLTTVTTSLRGFTTLLLGLYVAEWLTEGSSAEEGEFLAAFLKFEQLAAYSRVVASQQTGSPTEAYNEDNENAIRGIRRVVRNLNEGKGKVRISADSADQILANQKTYGLWGLYSVSARNSGWLETGSPRLAPPTRDFVELNYRARLQSADPHADVFRLFRHDFQYEPRDKHARLAQNLAELLSTHVTGPEQSFYYQHLITGASDRPDNIQERLWKQIRKANNPGPFSHDELLQVITQCRKDGDEELAQLLDHIRMTEAVIAPASRLFGFVLAQDGQAIENVAQDVRSTWGEGLRHIELAGFTIALSALGDAVDAASINRLQRLAETLSSGRYGEAVELLLEQNRAVMQERGGDAWVKRKGSQLDVRLSAEAGSLPAANYIPSLWMYNYFLNPLKQIGFEIERGV